MRKKERELGPRDGKDRSGPSFSLIALSGGNCTMVRQRTTSFVLSHTKEAPFQGRRGGEGAKKQGIIFH